MDLSSVSLSLPISPTFSISLSIYHTHLKVGTLEGTLFLQTGELVRLSQQALVDCSWGFGNNGCDGGEDFRAYQVCEYTHNSPFLSLDSLFYTLSIYLPFFIYLSILYLPLFLPFSSLFSLSSSSPLSLSLSLSLSGLQVDQ